MIKVFLSNTSRGASLQLVAQLKKQRASGGRHVVIVPDRFALSAERFLIEELGTRGLFDVEVMSFTRLARAVLRTSLRRSLSPESAVMLMRRAIDEVRPELEIYAGAARTAGFAGEMFAVLGSVRNNDVTVAQLKDAAEKMSGLSAMKARDIARIFDRYNGLLDENYEDMTSRLNALAEEIPEDEDVPKTHYYVMEFSGFTAVQCKILRQLAKYAGALCIAVTTRRGKANAATLGDETAQKAVGIAAGSGRRYEVVCCDEDLSYRRKKTTSHLYSYERTTQDKTEEVKLYHAEDARDEVVNLASYIRYLVVEKGYRYRDVAVVCADEEYKRLIKEIFPIYDIAYFADVKEAVCGHVSAKFVLAYLRTLQSGLGLDNVLALMKTPYFDAERRDVDKFENYCLRFSVDRRRFAQPFQYDFDGVDAAERARQVLMKLVGYNGALPTDVRGHVKLLYDFMDRAQWDARGVAFADRQMQAGDVEGAEITRQATERVRLLLSEMEDVMGDVPISLREFIGVFESMLTESKISLIPFYQDCVYVGDTKESRYAGVKAMFVIGASDGVIPAIGTESGILSEAELMNYREVGVNIEPTSVTAYREEKAVLADLLAKPTELLYVSCTVSSGKDEKKPSSLFSELSRLFGCTAMNGREFKRQYKEVYLHRFSTKSGAESALLRADKDDYGEVRRLYEITDDERPHGRRNTVNVPEKALFRRGTTKVSQLESYFACPMKHFLQYVLKLKERQEGIKSVDVGILVHAVLEHFFAECDLSMPDEDCIRQGMEIAAGIMARDYPFIEVDTPTYNDMIHDVRVILTDTLERQRHTRFLPRYFEAKIGMDGPFDALDVAGLKLVGVVDRIDCYADKYVTVIDYKTGSPKGELKEVFYGEKIQLYVYLSSIVQKGYLPAGVFYYPVNLKYDTDGTKKHVLKGQIAKDGVLAGAVDDTIGKQAGRFVAVKLGADGSVNTGLSEGDFEALMRYCIEVSKGAIGEMRDGYIAPSPASSEMCKWCAYRSMCPSDVTERKNGAVKIEAFYGEANDERS